MTEANAATVAEPTTPQERHQRTAIAATAPSARRSVACNLRRAAEAATGHATASAFPWYRTQADTLAHVRATLGDRYAPTTANASLAAVRGVLKLAWLAGDMEHEDYERAREALKRVRGSASLGRVLAPRQIAALFGASADGTPAGARDAALFAILYGVGLRSAEAAAATIADLDAANGTLTVRGKGRRQRLAHPFENGCGEALRAWLAVRGGEAGPLFCAVQKGGRVRHGHAITPRAIAYRLAARAERAGITGKVSPHTLRRSCATHLLEGGNDLDVVADVLGHASTATTRRYDRRGEAAKRRATATLAVPFAG